MRPDRWFLACAAIIAITLLRVGATGHVFSPTFDEGAHIAAGQEYLVQHTYLVDPQHPPLARIFFALPFLGTPPPPGDMIGRGKALLETGDHVPRKIAQARRGNLLFLLVGCIGVTLWARHLFGKTTALIALLFFASLPPVLAHAGLATTDMSTAAVMPFALYALTLFLDDPTWTRTLALGLTFGFGLLTKFSFLPFFAVAAVVLFVIKRRFPIARGLVAIVVGFCLVWAMYGFTVSSMAKANPRTVDFALEMFHSKKIAEVPLPAPLYFAGIFEVKLHDIHGHDSYLFGHRSSHGWWYYFPAALLFKTPIPFLILAAAGIGMLARRRAAPELAVAAAAIMAVAMTTGINIGVRHILPIYAPLAIAAAYAVVTLGARIVVVLLAAWLVVGSLLATPDYLPWMNALALGHPERVLVDSNLDWGQDLFRLAHECRERHVQNLGTAVFTTTSYAALGIPSVAEVPWYERRRGWNAVSETVLQEARAKEPLAYQWLIFGRDFVRVGKTIRLYYVP
ncbi:MAG TPA: glycosyltransferase family 39 protein [Thermoanaerobaculia bacterium]|nr:glycosyltransferase family 39 protein [Thermoanaerobaculia bacterium]